MPGELHRCSSSPIFALIADLEKADPHKARKVYPHCEIGIIDLVSEAGSAIDLVSEAGSTTELDFSLQEGEEVNNQEVERIAVVEEPVDAEVSTGVVEGPQVFCQPVVQGCDPQQVLQGKNDVASASPRCAGSAQYPAALPNDIGKSCTSFRRKRPTSCYDFVDGQSSSRPCPMRCEEQEEDCLGCCQRGGRHNTWHGCRNCNPWIGLEAKENWTSFRQKRHAPAPDKAGRRHYSCKPQSFLTEPQKALSY